MAKVIMIEIEVPGAEKLSFAKQEEERERLCKELEAELVWWLPQAIKAEATISICDRVGTRTFFRDSSRTAVAAA